MWDQPHDEASDSAWSNNTTVAVPAADKSCLPRLSPYPANNSSILPRGGSSACGKSWSQGLYSERVTWVNSELKRDLKDGGSASVRKGLHYPVHPESNPI